MFTADVTLRNEGPTALSGIKAILRDPNPQALRVVNPNGYASDDAPFIEYVALTPGQQQTLKWRLYSPTDQTGTLRVDLTSMSGARLSLSTASPVNFAQDRATIVTVRGADIRAETAFFIESTKLEVKSWREDQADVLVPAGFPASTYGIMAVNPNGDRAVLYPAFTTTPAAPAAALDPKTHARSFVDGFVLDITTKRPIGGAKVGVPGLTTTTADNGYFLLRGVPQGRHAVEIDAVGYERVFRFAEVNGDKQTVTLKLAELQPTAGGVSMIGPEGGIHRANNGSFLKIPAGALNQTVPIEFTQLTGANALPELPQDGYFLAFARLGPVGLTFNKPATLYLPLQPGIVLADGTPIRISYYGEKEQRWIQDITSGVITTIDGRQYLEYEINHFTWIGGQWFSDQVSGCVVDDEGTPLPGIVTNWGVTNEAGQFYGSTTRSDAGRMLTASLADQSLAPNSDQSVYYSGRGAVTFKCITIIDGKVPIVTRPYIAKQDPDDCNVYGSSAHQISKLDVASVEPLAGIYPVETNVKVAAFLPTFSRQKIDPSKLELNINGTDFIGQTDIQLDASGNLNIDYLDKTAQSGIFNVTVKAQNRAGRTTTKTGQFARIAQIRTETFKIIPFDNDVLPADVVTPFYVDTAGGKTVVIRDSDIQYGSNGTRVAKLKVQVRALDAQANIIPLNEGSVGFDNSWGSGEFKDGVATILTEIPVDAGVEFDPGSIVIKYQSSNAATKARGSPSVNSLCDQPKFATYDTLGVAPKFNVFDKIYASKFGKATTDWLANFADSKQCINNFCFSNGDAVTFIAVMTPYAGDLGVLAQQATNWWMGKGLDKTEATLSGISLAADWSGAGIAAGTVGSGFVGIYKISKASGKGLLATAIKDALERGPKLANPLEAMRALKDELGFLGSILLKTGPDGIRRAEALIDTINQGIGFNLRNSTLSPSDLLRKAVSDFKEYTDNIANASTTTNWLSPGNLRYTERNPGKASYQTTLDHIIEHADATKLSPTFTVFAKGKEEVLQLIDDAWTRIQMDPIRYLDPLRPNNFRIDFADPIGLGGEKTLLIAINPSIPGPPYHLLTAFPVSLP